MNSSEEANANTNADSGHLELQLDAYGSPAAENNEHELEEEPPILEPQNFEDHQNFSTEEDDKSAFLLGDDIYVDNGILYQKPQDDASNFQTKFQQQSHQRVQQPEPIDNESNICCGLCGCIIPYAALVTDHLPNYHPEVLADGLVDLEEIPYEAWLNEQQQQGAGVANGADNDGGPMSTNLLQQQPVFRPVRSTRQLRRISQYRVNTAQMSIPELELALQKKMVEKMGRKVPVTLMDKLHAKCGICDTVISLNKKFEIVHLTRHFHAWHPTAHKCAGTWPNKLPTTMPTVGAGKPLSAQDFAVIDTELEAVAENLQCVWCGMFLSNRALGMHFHEVHPEEVEVPKCNLCMQELLINARLTERFNEDFGVTLPDEHHFRSIRFKRDFKSEAALEKAIVKYLKRIEQGCDPNLVDIEDLDPAEEAELDEDNNSGGLPSCEAFANSRMDCGRRKMPKRQFIAPIVRQAAPLNSPFVRAITHSHWKCKLCRADIFAAVISAGVIKHFKKQHRDHLAEMKMELCQARLDKVSDGNMVICGEEQDWQEGTCVIECQLCMGQVPMKPPFNICRAVRHIKMKHPEVMPEHKGGDSSRDNFQRVDEDEMEEEELLQEVAAGTFQQQQEQGMPGPGTSQQQMATTAGGTGTTSHPTNSTAAAAAADPNPNTGAGANRYIKIVNHVLENGVIYATELVDPSMVSMLRSNYNVNFDRVYSVYGNEIEQEIFVLTMAGDELDSGTVKEIVDVRDPTQNPMVVILNREIEKREQQQQHRTATSTIG